MTSAPICARYSEQYGPGSRRDRSSTRMPASKGFTSAIMDLASALECSGWLVEQFEYAHGEFLFNSGVGRLNRGDTWSPRKRRRGRGYAAKRYARLRPGACRRSCAVAKPDRKSVV